MRFSMVLVLRLLMIPAAAVFAFSPHAPGRRFVISRGAAIRRPSSNGDTDDGAPPIVDAEVMRGGSEMPTNDASPRSSTVGSVVEQSTDSSDSSASGWRSIFPKGPAKEPEPPMPLDPALRSLAVDFGFRKGIASNIIWISVLLGMKAKGGSPGVILAKQAVEFWLWPLFSLSAMWEEMTKCAKRDALHRAPNKVLNLSILLAGLHLLVAKAASVPLLASSRLFQLTIRVKICVSSAKSLPPIPKLGGGRVPVGVVLLCILPSFNAARRFGGLKGIRDWSTGGEQSSGLIRWGGSVLSTAYGVLAVEAFASALIKPPASLPFVRAAVLYVLHITTSDNNRNEVGAERFRRLNDVLFYLSFGMFGGANAGIANVVPAAYLIMSTQAKKMSSDIALAIEEEMSSDNTLTTQEEKIGKSAE